jgi:hypothetical protein
VSAASVAAGIGVVSNFNVAANVVTVNLTGVANAQTIIVNLSNVNNGTNISDVEARMSVLVGDTNGNGAVNSADVAQTKSRIGLTVDVANFRSDVNVNGSINAGDVAQVKSMLGSGLSRIEKRNDY